MMKFFHITEYQYLIHLKRRYSWQELREKAKVSPDTYSETFAKKIYASVFEYSINLIDEYRKYYEKEYESIDQFLFWRYGISEEILNQITEKSHGFLAIFTFDYWIDEEEIFKTSIEQLFREVEGGK